MAVMSSKRIILRVVSVCLMLVHLTCANYDAKSYEQCRYDVTDDQRPATVIHCNGHVDFEKALSHANAKGLSVELHANNNYQMITIERLPHNNKVRLLNLTNNSIRTIAPAAFADLPNLEKLILANNSLKHLATDMFQGLKGLKSLDLSRNHLTYIRDILIDMKDLEELILAGNQFSQIPDEVMKSAPSLRTLDLSANLIYILSLTHTNLPNLQTLNLSQNNITVVTKGTFESLTSLESLDLSGNKLVKIESTGLNIPKLRYLDLSHNKLSDAMHLQSKIEWINLKSNNYVNWPFDDALDDLKFLNLESNNLLSLQVDESYKNLETLLVSGNSLSDFPNVHLEKLSVLNLADNNFLINPPELNSAMLPNLKYLELSGNPMSEVKFENTLLLEKLVIDNMHQMIKLSGLGNIVGRKIIGESDKVCLDLSVANCEKLSVIEDNAFEDITLCRLNISHNALTNVPLSVPRGVELDLQGNPLACTCSLQWVLDDILPSLYDIYPQVLRDLRCNGHRLVRWYRWKDRPLCNKGGQLADLQDLSRASVGGQPELRSSKGFLIVAGCSLVVLVALVAAGMYHTKVQSKKYKAVKRNRRLQA